MMTDQGSAYTSFIQSELAVEITRRATINDQAGKSITGAGAQFAIVTALVVFLRGSNFHPTGIVATVLFGGALILYLGSVAAGLLATGTHKTPVATPKFLTAMLESHWTDDEVTARNVVALAQVKQLAGMREGNNRKTAWLKRSLLVQVLAIFMLAAAVISTIA